VSLPTLPATTGHGKTLLVQPTRHKCGEHFLDAAANAGKHANSAAGQHRFQRLRDTGANQRSDAKFRQFLRALVSRIFFDEPFTSGNLSAIGQFDQQQLPGNIKDRRNAAVPDWNGEFHGRLASNCRAETLKPSPERP
jgi:hypothetical protein